MPLQQPALMKQESFVAQLCILTRCTDKEKGPLEARTPETDLVDQTALMLNQQISTCDLHQGHQTTFNKDLYKNITEKFKRVKNVSSRQL